jgi:hypothetical protein
MITLQKGEAKMKKMTIAIILICFGLCLGVGTAAATTTGISPAPGSEVSLVEPGGILDQIYGLSNLTRIDDDFDQIWFPADQTVTARAKYAGFNQEFGYIPDLNSDSSFDESFVPLFSVTGNGINIGPTANLSSGDVNYIWALNPSGAPQWTSLISQNSDSLDHMVTWRIDGGAGNIAGNYVIAWEDLPGGGDRDFNDLVVEWGQPVPEPTTMLLLASGLVGLAGFGRKRFKK